MITFHIDILLWIMLKSHCFSLLFLFISSHWCQFHAVTCNNKVCYILCLTCRFSWIIKFVVFSSIFDHHFWTLHMLSVRQSNHFGKTIHKKNIFIISFKMDRVFLSVSFVFHHNDLSKCYRSTYSKNNIPNCTVNIYSSTQQMSIMNRSNYMTHRIALIWLILLVSLNINGYFDC